MTPPVPARGPSDGRDHHSSARSRFAGCRRCCSTSVLVQSISRHRLGRADCARRAAAAKRMLVIVSFAPTSPGGACSMAIRRPRGAWASGGAIRRCSARVPGHERCRRAEVRGFRLACWRRCCCARGPCIVPARCTARRLGLSGAACASANWAASRWRSRDPLPALCSAGVHAHRPPSRARDTIQLVSVCAVPESSWLSSR